MDFVSILNEYGLIVVLAGLIASVLCGLIKLPIKKKIYASVTLTDKAKSDRVNNICTAIVAIISVIEIVVFRCVLANSFQPLLTKELYVEILTAIAFSKIAYMLYEGVGPVSIKKWIHILIDKIKTKSTNAPLEKKDAVTDWVNITQSILLNVLRMPMTDEQKDVFEKTLRAEQNSEDTNGTDKES